MRGLPNISRLSANDCHALIQLLRKRIEDIRSGEIAETLLALFREALLPAESSYVPTYTKRPKLQDMLPLLKRYGFLVLSPSECGDNPDSIYELTGGLIESVQLTIEANFTSCESVDDPEACSDYTEFHSYQESSVPAFMRDPSGGLLPGPDQFMALDYDCYDDWYLRPGIERATSYGNVHVHVFYPAYGKALDRREALSYYRVTEKGLSEKCAEAPNPRKRDLRSTIEDKKIHYIPSFVV